MSLFRRTKSKTSFKQKDNKTAIENEPLPTFILDNTYQNGPGYTHEQMTTQGELGKVGRTTMDYRNRTVPLGGKRKGKPENLRDRIISQP
jgi:hypothetical protein